MSRLGIGVAGLALGLYTLCAPAGPTHAQPIESTEFAGIFVHEFSGAVFPEELEGFRRTKIGRYDATGRDIGVNYERRDAAGTIYLTAYVYPSPKARGRVQRKAACIEDHRGSSEAIGTRFAGAKTISQSAAAVVNDAEPELALRSSHSFRTTLSGLEQDVQSELQLYCYVAGEWQVKYRISAPVAADLGSARAFVERGPWPRRKSV